MTTKDEALTLALEALESGKNHGVVIDVLRRALAEQPAQQPYCDDCGGFDPECPLAEQPAQQQEPVGQLQEEAFGRGQVMWFNKPVDQSMLYTSPPASKPWVGLTVDEVDECYYWKARLWTTDELVRHVEAKLREKNQ